MTPSKAIKAVLFAIIYGIHLSLALMLWLCGIGGNIMLGILLIVFYRLSLWLSPLAVTLICWLPLKPKASIRRRLLCNLVHLLLCAALFVLCFLLFGNWY